jgi:MFS family permease
MVNPPENFKPKGWQPSETQAAANQGGVGFAPNQMLKTSQFYSIWVVFLSSAIAGLMVIYCIKLFGVDALEFRGVANAGLTTETAVAWLAIFNGLGRILWGMISDRIGRKTAIVIMSLAQGAAMLMTYHVFIHTGLTTGLIVAACLIGFNYGGIFALFPAITADYFGNKEVGRNYGWIFSAYGVAGIVGPLLAGIFKDAAAGGASPIGWMTPFLIAGVSCLIGGVIMLFTNAPQPKSRASAGGVAMGQT